MPSSIPRKVVDKILKSDKMLTQNYDNTVKHPKLVMPVGLIYTRRIHLLNQIGVKYMFNMRLNTPMKINK